MRFLGFLRLTNARLISQIVFFGLFLFSLWTSSTSRLAGYPVSRLLELDPLVALSTVLSTGTLYRYLGWSIGIVVLTLVFGRVFCNWICPFGALHQFVDWVFSIFKTKERISLNSYSKHQSLKFYLLLFFLLLSLFGMLQIGFLDPLALIYRGFSTFIVPAWDQLITLLDQLLLGFGLSGSGTKSLTFKQVASPRIYTGSFWMGLFFLGFVMANIWQPRFFCRFLCPLGAMLGVIARFSLFRINRDVHRCTDCNLCLTRCEGAAEPHNKLRVSECFTCMNCIDDCPEDALQYTLLGQDKNQVVPGTSTSRRGFLFAGLSGLLTLPLLRNNGFATDENFSPLMIRPPGSVEEREFLERCIRCEQCMGVCPTNVLQPATFKEGGFETLWTPVMNFNIKHCQLKCNLCSEVCPTGAIRKITTAEKLGAGQFEKRGPVVLGTAFINPSRCLPWANQIPCVVCEEVCPVAPKAIQSYKEEEKDVYGKVVTLSKPFIVPDLCIGCGICQSECPVQDQPAVYITAVGESRSKNRRMLLQSR